MSSPSRAARILRSTYLALTLIAIVIGAVPAGATAAKKCAGKRATIVGTPGDDVLVGKRASDVIVGLGGNDKISGGRNGNDRICGGPGRDRLDGRRGKNVLVGGGGRDRLIGSNSGNERLAGGRGRDVLTGGEGKDSLRGGRGSDKLLGGRGSDRLRGEDGDDRLSGGGGNDRADGGPGNDSVHGSSDNDNLSGGEGNDRVFGENGNDRVAGGSGNDFVNGGLGDELPRRDGGVFGNGGADLVVGGTGGDLVVGGPGSGDVVRGDQGPDTIRGGPGRRDIASYTTASVVSRLRKIRGCRRTGGFALSIDLGRGIACEFLTPKKILREPLSGIEDVAGTSYRDRIRGNSGSNRIDGGPGNDVLRGGGGGGDRAFGGSGFDDCGAFAVSYSCPGPASKGKTGAVELARSIDGSRTLVVRGSSRSDRLRVTRTGRGFAVVSARRLRVTGCRTTGNGAFCKVGRLSTILINARGGKDRIVIARDVPASVGVTASGGRGSDLLVGGDGPDHLLGGTGGRDVIRGRRGGDAQFGGGGGPDRLFGGPGNDVNTLPATCRGGSLIAGGSGRDNASYALSKHAWCVGGEPALPDRGVPQAPLRRRSPARRLLTRGVRGRGCPDRERPPQQPARPRRQGYLQGRRGQGLCRRPRRRPRPPDLLRGRSRHTPARSRRSPRAPLLTQLSGIADVR